MAEFTTLEIAAMCQRTERTVQRWLKTGRLPATHLQGNRYEVNESDLARFLPHEVADDLVDRIESLERRVTALEATSKPSRSQRTPSRPEATSSTLPDGYVPIADLIRRHNAPETSVMRNMRPYLKRGHWKTSDGRSIKSALDLEGQAEFMRRYGK